jgi:polyisoprenoid-binding protein YceI
MNLIFKSAIILALVAGSSINTREMKTINTSESQATWTGKKFGGQHTGTIDLQSGTLEFTDDNLTGGDFVIDMTSLSTTDLSGDNKDKLDGHLKSDDFFGTASHPTAALVFTDVKKEKDGVYTVTADLTIKETTEPITFELVTGANTATTQLNIDRSKYNVKYGSKSFFKGLGDNFIYDNFEVEVKLVY